MDVDRVCFVSLPLYGYFEPDAYDRTGGGGAKRQLHMLSRRLLDRFEVHAVVGDYGQPRRVEREGVVLHRAYPPNGPSAPASFLRLLAAMRRADADLYVYRGNPRKAAAVYAASTLLRRRWAYHVASDAHLGAVHDDCHPVVRWLFRRGLGRAHAVVAQTPHQRDLLDRRFGVEAATVPNGYPPSDVASQGDGDYFLWVGRLDREQNRPHLLLDAAEALPDERFRVVGIPTVGTYYERVVERAAAMENVDLVESVPPDEIHGCYRDAIALVNTAAYEGFPNTFLEAWRWGTPVASLDVDPSRYLGEGMEAVHADGDLATLVGEIELLAADPQRQRELGDRARRYVERNYGIDAVAEQYAEILADGTGDR